MSETNYYDNLSPEEKLIWNAKEDHLWKVELPAQLRRDQDAAEADWSSKGQVWSWIGGKEWQFGFGWYFLNHPKHACKRIVRLSLPHDGQLRIIENFALYHDAFPDRGKCTGETCLCDSWPTYPIHDFRTYPERSVDAHLLATAEVGGSLHHFRGTQQDTYPNEMNGSAVIFARGTPQAVVDECARILDLSMREENFYALLDGVDRCAICRKPLRDELSKLIAAGPDCAKQYGIPHNLEAASKRLALRKKLLAP